jgi:hypothetical protein
MAGTGLRPLSLAQGEGAGGEGRAAEGPGAVGIEGPHGRVGRAALLLERRQQLFRRHRRHPDAAHH